MAALVQYDFIHIFNSFINSDVVKGPGAKRKIMLLREQYIWLLSHRVHNLMGKKIIHKNASSAIKTFNSASYFCWVIRCQRELLWGYTLDGLKVLTRLSNKAGKSNRETGRSERSWWRSTLSELKRQAGAGVQIVLGILIQDMGVVAST